MSVEGVSKSAIARIQSLAWNTVARWLELATEFARRFNARMIRGFELVELQADEICTMLGNKRKRLWAFTSLEVWSRLWISFVVGERCYAGARALLSATINRGRLNQQLLFTSDGFEPYGWAIKKLLSSICIYGQVIKFRRGGHVVKIQRRLILGTKADLRRALAASEDSTVINTSFVERLNLIIRQGSAYLCRHTLCFARRAKSLVNHLELLRCYYNFIRPHRGLQFGRQRRTPAMQVGLASRKLSFREVFAGQVAAFFCVWIRFSMRRYVSFPRPCRSLIATLS